MSNNTLRLEGIYPPIPTPFDAKRHIATKALTGNLRIWNRYELRGYVVLGSNGELALLNDQERLRVLEVARAAIPADKLMIAGTGCQSTLQTIELTRQAAEIGADAALVVSPFYYKGQMTSGALIEHFHRVADASPIPVIIYNMPACTGIDLGATTVIAIAEHENILAIKDSGGSLAKMAEIHRLAPLSFAVPYRQASSALPTRRPRRRGDAGLLDAGRSGIRRAAPTSTSAAALAV